MAMPKLKPEVKKQWLEALRSGKYKQGKGYLKAKDNEYCCLGVLCEVQNVPNSLCAFSFQFDFLNQHTDHKEIPIQFAITLFEENAAEEQVQIVFTKLIDHNDGAFGYGKSFKWIASYIERYL